MQQLFLRPPVIKTDLGKRPKLVRFLSIIKFLVLIITIIINDIK